MTLQPPDTISPSVENTLPPQVHDLLAAEKSLPPAPPGADARIWARIESSLAAPGATTTAAASTTSGWLVAGGLVATALIAVAVVMIATSSPAPTTGAAPTLSQAPSTAAPPPLEPTPTPTPEPTPTQAPTPTPTPTQAPTPAAAPMPEPTPYRSSPPPSAEPSGPSSGGPTGPAAALRDPPAVGKPAAAPTRPPSDPIAERKILTRAQVALRSNDAATALSAVAEHQRLYPRGELAEERESLAIVALHANGQTDRARDRANRFRARFPNSIYATALDRLGL
jgi:hypothetical protein